MPAQLLESAETAPKRLDGSTDDAPKKLPKGVVLGPDGKPCRSCTSFASWATMTKQQNRKASSVATGLPATAQLSTQLGADCPADVEVLGRSGWTLLHTVAANYPEQPSRIEQTTTRTFLDYFGRLYPCHSCAEDFRDWMRMHEPRVSSRQELGQWMCEAHNAVNEKLGKPAFDCNKWDERWRSGWKDGSCG